MSGIWDKAPMRDGVAGQVDVAGRVFVCGVMGADGVVGYGGGEGRFQQSQGERAMEDVGVGVSGCGITCWTRSYRRYS